MIFGISPANAAQMLCLSSEMDVVCACLVCLHLLDSQSPVLFILRFPSSAEMGRLRIWAQNLGLSRRYVRCDFNLVFFVEFFKSLSIPLQNIHIKQR